MADTHDPDAALRAAREAEIRAEIEARRRAAEEARLARLAKEYRLEDDSVPAVTVPDVTERYSAPQAMRYDEIQRFGMPICEAIELIDDLLPDIAGKLEVGIAANVDSAISKDKVLRVVMATTRSAAAIYSAAATLGAYHAECLRGSEVEKLLVGLAFAAVFYDIVGKIRAPGRSTWKIAGEYIVVDPKDATQALRDRVRDVLSKDKDIKYLFLQQQQK
jgi:hypothetical protein